MKENQSIGFPYSKDKLVDALSKVERLKDQGVNVESLKKSINQKMVNDKINKDVPN